MPKLSEKKKAMLESMTREAITRAVAELLLEEEGWKQITIEKLAQRTGVSKGTIYNYFKNKHDLVFSIIERNMQNLEVLLGKIDLARSPVLVLDEVLDVTIRDVLEHRRVIAAMMRVGEEDPDFHLAKGKCGKHPIWPVRRFIREVYVRGVAEGVFRADDPVFVETIMQSAFFGFVRHMGIGEIDEEDLPAFSKSLKAFLMNGICVKGEGIA